MNPNIGQVPQKALGRKYARMNEVDTGNCMKRQFQKPRQELALG
jgi:hypothetical protein